jgi:SAM-dependent methyltransferase
VNAWIEQGRRVSARLGRLLGRSNGRLPSLGHDYDRGHRAYVSRLSPGNRLWLRTKPFSAPPSFELAACLHTFAHIVDRLELGVRAQVLDLGCGPGWLSEYLARCGYWVTGVDISEEMIAIARERYEAIGGEVGEGLEPKAEFHALPVRELPWTDRFDAAVLYDTMHHFDDELETLRVIRRALVPGGKIYIREGVRPEPGSESERHLIAEMEEFGTLESPFDPRYLVDVVEQAGFEHVVRYMEVDELVDVTSGSQAARLLTRLARHRLGLGDTNTLIASRPLPAGALTDAAHFSARIEQGAPPARDDGMLIFPLGVTNTGRSFWPTGAFPFPQGVVSVGPYAEGPEGRIEFPRAVLPHAVSPGEQVHVAVRVPEAAVREHTQVKVDLVREGLAWFGELGSEPLVLQLTP